MIENGQTLFSLDLDRSLIGEKVGRSVGVINGYHDAGKAKTVINTGNDAAQLHQYGYARYIPDLKVDALVLNDGQQVIMSPDAGGTDAKRLFETATSLPLEQQWQSHLESLGWDAQQITSTINHMAEQSASRHNLNDGRFSLRFRNDKPKLDIHGPVDEASQQRVKLYLDDISSQLQRQGVQVEGHYSISGNKYKVVFGPKGVNKKTPLDHLTSKWREVTSAVTLGDNDNDREMLLAEKFGTKEGGFVPNYPILVGDHVDLSQRVSQMENGLLVSSANVSEGLKVQAEKALTTGVRKLARFA